MSTAKDQLKAAIRRFTAAECALQRKVNQAQAKEQRWPPPNDCYADDILELCKKAARARDEMHALIDELIKE